MTTSLYKTMRKSLPNSNNQADALHKSYLQSLVGCVLETMTGDSPSAWKYDMNDKTVTVFHSAAIPSCPIKKYFLRLATYAECSAECYVMALMYINTLLEHRPNFKLSIINIHRLLLVSLLVAAKFTDDHYYNNAYYAKIGGITKTELATIEIEFLALINFDLYVTDAKYKHFYEELTHPSFHASNSCSCRNRVCACVVCNALPRPSFMPVADPIRAFAPASSFRPSSPLVPTVSSPSTSSSGMKTRSHSVQELRSVAPPKDKPRRRLPELRTSCPQFSSSSSSLSSSASSAHI